MATLTYTEARSVGRSKHPLMARIAALYRRFAATRKGRRDLESLRSASDHVLSDIGVTRGDLERALASPIWVNPTDRLIRGGR